MIRTLPAVSLNTMNYVYLMCTTLVTNMRVLSIIAALFEAIVDYVRLFVYILSKTTNFTTIYIVFAMNNNRAYDMRFYFNIA